MKWRKRIPPELGRIPSQNPKTATMLFNLKVYTMLYSQVPGQEYLHTIGQYVVSLSDYHLGRIHRTRLSFNRNHLPETL